MYLYFKKIAYNILRISEKFFKTDMVYLVKGGSLMLAGKFITLLFIFIMSVVMANLLPREVYGQYKYVIAIINVIMLFTLTGMGMSVAASVSRGKDNVVYDAVYAEKRWGIFGALTAFVISVHYYIQGNSSLALTFLIITIFAPFLNVYSLYAAILQGKKNFYLITLYDILSQLIMYSLLLPMLFLTKNVWLLIIPMLLYLSLIQKYFLWRTEKVVVLNSIKDPDVVKFGKHLSLVNVLSVLASYADQIIVFNLLGPVQAAIYSIALAPPEQLRGIYKIINTLAFPKFAIKELDALKESVPRKMLVFFLIILLPTLVYIYLAPILFKFIFSEYPESVLYTQLFAISLLATGSFLPLSVMQAKSLTKNIYIFYFISLGFLITTIIVAGYKYGLAGIVIGRVCSKFVDLALSYYLLKKSK